MEYEWQYFLRVAGGYIYSVFISQWLIVLILKKLRDRISAPLRGENIAINKTLGRPLGWVESGLYTASLHADYSPFIAVWLAFKVASNLQGWRKGPRFYIFLLGNGLSIAYSFAGWKIFDGCFQHSNFFPAIIVLLGSIGIYLWLREQKKARWQEDLDKRQWGD